MTVWLAILGFTLACLIAYIVIYLRKRQRGFPNDDKRLYQRTTIGLACWTILVVARLVLHQTGGN